MLFLNKTSPLDFLVVGLGNPGRKYEESHHNAGFMALDSLAERLGARVTRAKFDALTGAAVLAGKKVLLLKPQTFMNLSGKAVGAAANFYKLQPQQVLVLYDDIALAPGKLRIRPSGSAGGHNGIKSIIGALGTQDFPRIRIGVGERRGGEADLADFVLASFSTADRKLMLGRFDDVYEAAGLIVNGDVAAAMNRYNG
ncbi:MAG: aminoacyl-tRNA hydrolase [Pygmaiobacter sp.]|jgi:PTH1 family peptidyl-tRNA hydrolase|nr:aminoacyl-tRNA hydrolase [Pygmaiobacter sp.]